MKFTFAEKKMDSSEDLRAYAVKKIGKLDRFFRNEAEAFVTFSIERGRFRAEITRHRASDPPEQDTPREASSRGCTGA